MENQKEFEQLYQEAHKAGMAALAAKTPRPMVVQQRADPLDDNSEVVQEWFEPEGVCGFAWINVKPGTSRFARWLKANGKGRPDSYYGGVTIWVREGNQSYELKMAYAEAFAAVLVEAGIKAYASGRLD